MDRAHRVAREQERVTATKHGGRGTPASGSGDIKNDVRTADFSIEVKTTTKKTYSLALETWDRAERFALEDGRRAAMVVAFDRGSGQRPKRLVVIDEDDFIEMTTDGATP